MYERVWRVQGSKVLGAIYSHWGWCHSRVAWDGFSLEAAQCKYKLFLYIPLTFVKLLKCLLVSNFTQFIYFRFLFRYDSLSRTLPNLNTFRQQKSYFLTVPTRFGSRHYLALFQNLIRCKLVAISEELAFQAERRQLTWLTLKRW